jgi:hypothetical protein
VISETLGLLIALSNLALGCILGTLCGTATSLALRLPWRWMILLQDAAIAVTTMLFWAILVATYDSLQHSAQDRTTLILSAGTIAPVARHLIRLLLQRKPVGDNR